MCTAPRSRWMEDGWRGEARSALTAAQIRRLTPSVAHLRLVVAFVGCILIAFEAHADIDPVIQEIWVEGMQRSQIYPLAQTLLDSIGPRLTGSPEQKKAIDWATGVYRKLEIPVRAEQYGTWVG